MKVLGDVEHVFPRDRMTLIVFEDVDEASKRVERFVGHGVLGRREQVARGIESALDLVRRRSQDAAEALKMDRLECLRMRKAVQVMQPDPER